MPRLIIHPGMHKTGSTSIQATLFHNRAALRAQGVETFSTGQPAANVPMLKAFSRPDGVWLRHYRKMLGDDGVAEIQKQGREEVRARLAEADADTLVISAEEFFSVPAEGRAALIAMAREAGYDDILCLGYLRPPKSFVESMVQQRLKGGTLPVIGPGLFPDYKAYFEPFQPTIPAGAIHVRKFSREALKDGDAVADFLDWIGASLPEDAIRRENEGLSLTAIRLLYCRLKTIEAKRPNREWRTILPLMRKLDGPRLRIQPETLKPLFEKHRAQLDWAEARLGAPIEDLDAAPAEGVRWLTQLAQVGQPDAEALAGLAAAEGLDLDPPPTPEGIAEGMERLIDHMVAKYGAPAGPTGA